ncbi:GDNF-inducible zinc finger protein 1-like isoform X13 [Spodoptera litura]|uniref:GDNF-inducible zinc finger protein 1-like isoform X13 n=1 Tax=Spodoptera litura TaxID=69820 RepID=A0A9J7IL95_SPOLT|nr:GDNF-inducible zinc finger protein 1-like isoform X13 [Spodoptera litura]
MDPKTTDWRAGPNVCRCCLAEGCYKDISTEYFWMGKREVYAEMLSETLNLSIAYSNSGGPNSNSRLICELCISRLRDASDFKRQVQECERTFLRHLDPGSSSMVGEVEVTVEPTEIDPDVKLEHVKQEKAVSDDDDDFDERCGFDEDDDDDLDDQPLTRLASRIPKKESVDLLDLLDNTKATEKRKSSSKTKTVPAKKAKTIKKDVKATSSKAPVKTEKKKKEQNPLHIAKRNAQIVIQYVTAYPFRLPESSIVCVYCCESFDDASRFRKHMDDEHDVTNVKIAFSHIHEGYIKVDCSNLRCRICLQTFDKIGEAATHLNMVHNENIDLSHDVGVQPFDLQNDKLSCAVCNAKASNMRSLSRHIQKHFFQCTCELCGKCFATATSLQKHLEFSCPHVVKQRKCRKCKVVLYSTEDQKKHYENSRQCRQHLCSVCGDRFSTWKIKQNHMEQAHGIPKKVYHCPECRTVFKKANLFRAHFKIAHTDDHFECPSCDRKFDTKYVLDRHMVVHSNERLFSCDTCSKSFPRKSTLRQHMWIHSTVKRFECKMCDKQFNQKVSWKTHMKSYHPDLGGFS